jgi:3-methyladenine DNA glycosylase AlkD
MRHSREASQDDLTLELRKELERVAIPEKAAGMQAYMKSSMPYLGVPAPLLRKACKKVFAAFPLATPRAWQRATLSLWRGARHREERYAAIELTGDRRARPFRTMDALPMYEEMIVTGAWWDYVDGIASHRLGELLEHHPKEMKRTMLTWSRSGDLWKRRSSIICQLGFKERTDTGLLYACIEPSIDSREFFLRKAIGWALRQYAWTDAREVVRYVKENESRLSGLSRREALKNC